MIFSNFAKSFYWKDCSFIFSDVWLALKAIHIFEKYFNFRNIDDKIREHCYCYCYEIHYWTISAYFITTGSWAGLFRFLFDKQLIHNLLSFFKVLKFFYPFIIFPSKVFAFLQKSSSLNFRSIFANKPFIFLIKFLIILILLLWKRYCWFQLFKKLL